MKGNSVRTNLLRIINAPRNAKEQELVDSLKVVGPYNVMHILNNVDSITEKQISDYGCANFEKLDFRPNPSDKLVSTHEVLESLQNSLDKHEQTILAAIWMRFEEIREAHKDFEGAEAAFDTQLSFKDFQQFGIHS